MKRVISIIAIGLFLITLYCIPVSAAEPENLITNGTPVMSTSGWFNPFPRNTLSYTNNSIQVQVNNTSIPSDLFVSFGRLALEKDRIYILTYTFVSTWFTTNNNLSVGLCTVSDSFIKTYQSITFNSGHMTTYEVKVTVPENDFYAIGWRAKETTNYADTHTFIRLSDVSLIPYAPRKDLNSTAPGVQSEAQQAQDDALGGKTNEQIQSEIEGAVDFDFSSFDNENTGSMRLFVVNVMNCFGGEYASVLLFSCVMGLAIFIIGRKSNGG